MTRSYFGGVGYLLAGRSRELYGLSPRHDTQTRKPGLPEIDDPGRRENADCPKRKVSCSLEKICKIDRSAFSGISLDLNRLPKKSMSYFGRLDCIQFFFPFSLPTWPSSRLMCILDDQEWGQRVQSISS